MPPLRFAANLSFLFTERPFLERFSAARSAGFTAVEFHFPYAEDKELLAATAQEAGVEVILFNLPPGDWDAGERGIACHPSRIAEFKEGVGRAIDYARALGCKRLNCLAGLTPADASAAQAQEVLIENLRFAAAVTQSAGIELMTEPLNLRDTPGYFVPTPRAGLEVISAVGHPNLKLQYDVYHAQVMEGDLARCLEDHLPQIGHIQFADNPGRHEPGTGEINFPFLFGHLRRIGYRGWVAAEYKPSVRTEDSLVWLQP